MTKKRVSKPVTVARAIRDDDFKIKNARVLAPFDNSTNRLVMAWHTFHKVPAGVLHRCDDVDRATVANENWPAYVKGNDAAALACEYKVPMQ